MWFSATLIFRSEIGGVRSIRPLCEERVVLFETSNEQEAIKAAEAYGRREAHSYANESGEEVRWQFVGIDKIHALDSPTAEGWEVAAKFVRRSWPTLQKLVRSQ